MAGAFAGLAATVDPAPAGAEVVSDGFIGPPTADDVLEMERKRRAVLFAIFLGIGAVYFLRR